MNEHYKGCWVVFDQDYDESQATLITQTISNIKGVGGCTIKEANSNDWLARRRVCIEMADEFNKLWQKLLNGHSR